MNDPSQDQLGEILDLYLRVPETPLRVSENDVTLVRRALQSGVEAGQLAHAIRVATLRRHLRDPEASPLAPVRSFAYYLRTLDGLDDEDFDNGYVEYIEYRFEALLEQSTAQEDQEPPSHDQKPALLLDR